MNVKFYMYFNGERIRTLDDLRDNFIAEDILEAYNNGQLVKWLEAWRHKNELEQVKAITSTNTREILSELIRIFSCDDESENIDSTLSLYDYLEARKKFREYSMIHGLNEVEALKQERDSLIRELEDVKKERDELRIECEKLKHEKQNEKTPTATATSNVKRLDIPAGSMGRIMPMMLDILPKKSTYRITDIGNCEGKLCLSDGKGMYNISEACLEEIKFNGLSLFAAEAYNKNESLYFYYEEV